MQGEAVLNKDEHKGEKRRRCAGNDDEAEELLGPPHRLENSSEKEQSSDICDQLEWRKGGPQKGAGP